MVPKNSIRRQAETIVANNTFVSVHRSWVSGECYALLNNKNCFCNISGTSPTGIANTAFYCGITEEQINIAYNERKLYLHAHIKVKVQNFNENNELAFFQDTPEGIVEVQGFRPPRDAISDIK